METQKPKVLLATTNKSKIKPFMESWHRMNLNEHFTLVSMDEVQDKVNFEVEEDTGTFEGDARKKAIAYSQATGIPAISLDRGIEFAASPGWPGTKSKEVFHGSSSEIINFLPEEALASKRDMAISRAQQLIDLLKDKDRTMFSVYGIAVALPSGEAQSEEIRVGGTVSESLNTDGIGYNYDWFYIPEGMDRTLSMMTEEEYLDFTSKVLWPIPKSIVDFLKDLLRIN